MIKPRIIPNVPASTTTITAPSQRRDQTGASAALNRRRSETEIAAADFSSSTTGDHIEVLTEALASIPRNFRPRPGDPDSPSVLIRSDSAGATYGFAKFCREVGVGFSFGFAVREAGPGRPGPAGRRRLVGLPGRHRRVVPDDQRRRHHP